MQVYYQIQESGEAVETSDNLNALDCGLEMVNNKISDALIMEFTVHLM